MKKIGLICDRKTKKVFLLPKEIKTLTGKQIEVYVQSGYGKCLNIADEQYLTNGAKILKKSSEVIEKAEIILKTNAFSKKEVTSGANKILITMANYVINAPMILEMLKNKVTGLAWNCLTNKNGYVFFPEFETIKGRHCVNQMIYAWAKKGLGISNAKTTTTHPRVLILNANYAAYEATLACLTNNIDVTLLDNDAQYLSDLKNSDEIKKIESMFGTKLYVDDAKFETMMKLFPTHQGFINTCIDPITKTKVRVTAEMAKSMPAGSFMIDAACDNGYGFNFQKDFASDHVEYKRFENVVYSCTADITDLYPSTVSKVISEKSVDYLVTLAEKGVDGNTNITNTIVTEYGKVVNDSIKKQLNLL